MAAATGAGAVAPACPADAHKDSSVVCRDPGGDCGLAESCSGDSALCPEDQHQDAAFVCRKATLECDETETCSGTSAACPADGFAPEGQTCRPPQGGCDAVAEGAQHDALGRAAHGHEHEKLHDAP